MIQVHQKFVEIDTAISTISSMQAASPQLAPQALPSATAQPSQGPWAAAAQSRMSDTAPHGGAPTVPSQEPKGRNVGMTTGNWIWTKLGGVIARIPRCCASVSCFYGRKHRTQRSGPLKNCEVPLVLEHISHTSHAIFESLEMIMSGCRAAHEHAGTFELWRKLHAEWCGSAPHVVSRSTTMSVNAAAVGSTAILGAIGVRGLGARLRRT